MILWFFSYSFFFILFFPFFDNNAVARLHLTPVGLCTYVSLGIRSIQFLFQRCSWVHQYKYVLYSQSNSSLLSFSYLCFSCLCYVISIAKQRKGLCFTQGNLICFSQWLKTGDWCVSVINSAMCKLLNVRFRKTGRMGENGKYISNFCVLCYSVQYATHLCLNRRTTF